jgi:DDE superfamily endonuclease
MLARQENPKCRTTSAQQPAPQTSDDMPEGCNEARGATLRYLPKYSPDLNPIEMPFSQMKAYLRKAGERTIPRLRRRIGSFARNLTAREAANYFRHAGYV